MLKSVKIPAYFAAILILFSCSVENGSDGSDSRDSNLRVDNYIVDPGGTVLIEYQDFRKGDTIILRSLSVDYLSEITRFCSWQALWKVPSQKELGPVGIFLKRGSKESMLSFIRVVDSATLTTYRIDQDDYKGLTVYELSGGMSAEYAVEKSLENLTAGIGHSWNIGVGGGPEPVMGTPGFLSASIKYTVDLYNKILGKSTEIKTVILSTGLPSVPYLSNAMKAPVLPLHFLVSVNSTKEVAEILRHSSKEGLECYSTLGYDGSMNDVGVAWVKMIGLPSEYIEFLKNHKVRNVIISGVLEESGGETYCRRVKGTGEKGREYSDGSLYILYTHSGSDGDIESLSSKILDYKSLELEPGKFLADWESGIPDSVIERLFQDVSQASVKNCVLIASDDMMDMYDFGTGIAMQFIHKNASYCDSYSGTVFNEYLISHSEFEAYCGLLPLLYWQLTPAEKVVSRMSRVQKIVSEYNDSVRVEKRPIYLNARLGKDALVEALKSKGYTDILVRTDGVEEVWDLSDGINAPCEQIADKIVEDIGIEKYKEDCSKMMPLNWEEFIQYTRAKGVLKKVQ